MPKHYRMKAATIEIVSDATVKKLCGYYWRRATTWIAWLWAVLLRKDVR